jgi:hypothetical protein
MNFEHMPELKRRIWAILTFIPCAWTARERRHRVPRKSAPGRSGLERGLWLLAPLHSPAGFVCSMHFLGQKRPLSRLQACRPHQRGRRMKCPAGGGLDGVDEPPGPASPLPQRRADTLVQRSR